MAKVIDGGLAYIGQADGPYRLPEGTVVTVANTAGLDFILRMQEEAQVALDDAMVQSEETREILKRIADGCDAYLEKQRRKRARMIYEVRQ